MLLAQVTDSHVRTIDAPHSEASHQAADVGSHLAGRPRATLEACLRQAFSSATPTMPELLVLTGDNAHGDQEDAAPYSKLQSTLDDCVPPGVPVEVLPGNHDRRRHLLALARMGGGRTRRTRLPACPHKATFASLEPCGWLVLGCDSLQEGSGHGQLGAVQLQWLSDTLQAHPNAPAILFMHHPPLPHLELGWSPGFTHQAGLLFDEDDRLALEVLFQGQAGQQVKAICVGHVHAEFEVPIAGVPVLGTPSSWVQHSITAPEPVDRVAYEDIPPGWRLIRLAGRTLQNASVETVVVRVGDGTPKL
jgi:Icc protein